MSEPAEWAMEKALSLDLRWNNDTEWIDIIARALAAERERAAKIAEARDLSIMSSTAVDFAARQIAAAIRKGE